ncbi:unnamed protein product [Caenorhabditis auriculariae]|uniref:DUF7627 domain-containing protein n=1 Tax=Caenorhabditis auriculariae TaxID=2777116 RepID=A0A8S1GSK9_9PELO|nr:unnamed protein product [Caenorhabditis auriculariae]
MSSRLNGRLSYGGPEVSRQNPNQEPPRRRSNVHDERGRRMFANIQSALGAPAGGSSGFSPRDRRMPRKIQEDEPPVEELHDVDEIIAQIADLNVRPDRSAAQIKRNITKCGFVERMDEDEWLTLCTALIEIALDQSEANFVVDIFSSLLKHEEFGTVMSSELMAISSSHVMEGGSKPIPAFLSAILCANWPRQYSKAIDSVNMLLFTTMQIVKGWIQVLDEDNMLFIKKEPKPVAPPLQEEQSDTESEAEDSDNEVEKQAKIIVQPEAEDEAEPEQEEPEIVNRCAIAIFDLCEAAQRSLWMKFPTLCDEIYDVIKPAITHNSNLTGETKVRLLQTLLALTNWTRSKAVTTKIAQTQTVAC